MRRARMAESDELSGGDLLKVPVEAVRSPGRGVAFSLKPPPRMEAKRPPGAAAGVMRVDAARCTARSFMLRGRPVVVVRGEVWGEVRGEVRGEVWGEALGDCSGTLCSFDVLNPRRMREGGKGNGKEEDTNEEHGEARGDGE